MAENLMLLPEAFPVARLLCDYLFSEGTVDGEIDLLILSKQRRAFAPLIAAYPFKRIHVLDEEYYGSVTRPESEGFVSACLDKRYNRAFFPFNTFKGNAFLFAGVLARRVTAVNASLYGIREVPVIEFSLHDRPAGPPVAARRQGWAEGVGSAMKRAAERLAEAGRGNVTVSGERPSFGLVKGFAHDIELFCNYAAGLRYAKGKRVLDIGGGLGYGTYLLSRFAREVVYVDRAPEAVEAIERLWVPLAPNITAHCADVAGLALNGPPYDALFLMEMLEHIEEPEELLVKVQPLLNKGGTILITTPEEDLFPYRVCPEQRWPRTTGEAPEELLKSAIWPWHIHPLGERTLLPMIERAGLKVVAKSYLTYSRGKELARQLNDAVVSGSGAVVFDLLNSATVWGIDDFSVTEERDPVFSAFFYSVAVTKR